MTLRNKLFTAGTVVLTTGLVSLEYAVARKDALVNYEISNNAVVSNLWYTQNMEQHYAGAFDDNKNGTADRILLREIDPTPTGSRISFQVIRPENPKFKGLLDKIRK